MQLIVNTEDAKAVKNIPDLLLLSLIKSKIVPGYNKVILNYLAVQKQLNLTKRSLSSACKHLNNIYGITFGKNQIIVYLNKKQFEETKKKPSTISSNKQRKKTKKTRRKVTDFQPDIIDATTEILDYLNTLTTTQHKVNVTNCELVSNALKQGYTKQQIFMLISRMYIVWHQSEYSQYLVLSTLLKPNKIDDYLNKPLNGHHIPRILRKNLRKYGLTIKQNNIIFNNAEPMKREEESIVGY